MNIWLIILFIMASAVFGLDYLFRRKKWEANSKGEKISLIVNMFSVGPYIFLSALGMLWGIAVNRPETTFGRVLYDATLTMGGIYFVVAVAAVILSFIFRKIGKIKASIWIHIFALAYMLLAFVISYLSGEIL